MTTKKPIDVEDQLMALTQLVFMLRSEMSTVVHNSKTAMSILQSLIGLQIENGHSMTFPWSYFDIQKTPDGIVVTKRKPREEELWGDEEIDEDEDNG